MTGIIQSKSDDRVHGYHLAECTTANYGGSFSNNIMIAQEFQTDDLHVAILTIKLSMMKVATTTDNVIVELRNGTPAGSSILKSWTILSSEFSSIGTVYDFTLYADPPYKLIANQTYSIVIRSNGSSSNYVLRYDNVGSRGKLWYTNSGETGWTSLPAYNCQFLIRTAATWYNYDDGIGDIVVNGVDQYTQEIFCNLTDPWGGEHTNVGVEEEASVTYYESGDSAEWYKFTNLAVASSGDTWLIEMKQEVEKWHYVSTSGSDDNNGKTPTTAWRTFQKGVRSIGAGDNLRVFGGMYYSSDNNEGASKPYTSGEAGKPLNIECDAVTTFYNDESELNGIDLSALSYINISGLTLEKWYRGIILSTGSHHINIENCGSNKNDPNTYDIELTGTDNTIQKCVFNNIVKITTGGSGGNILKLSSIRTLIVDSLVSGWGIYWNRIKYKTINSSLTWWALVFDTTVVGNYWYGEEENDTNGDCYGFVNLNGVDVYNQIVALGVAYDGCLDNKNTAIGLRGDLSSVFKVNISGVEKGVYTEKSGITDTDFIEWFGRDVEVGGQKILCILDRTAGSPDTFIIQGSSKITCKKNEW